MGVVAAILDVVTIVMLGWKFAKPAAKRVLGLGAPVAAGAVGAKAAVESAGMFSKIPKWFVSLFEKGGKLRWMRDIAFFLKNSISAPVIFAIMFVLSAYFPTVAEKIFLVVGAVFAKFGLMFMKWASGMAADATENNTEDLYEIMGETVDVLPPCFIDVLGYCHLVEDLGMIISTAIFVGIYNLIKYFYFRWV